MALMERKSKILLSRKDNIYIYMGQYAIFDWNEV